MVKKEIIKRYGLFMIGIFFISLGVNFTIVAQLGTTSLALIPYILNLATPLSLGLLTFLFNLGLIFIQIIILRSKFELKQLMQIPLGFIFGMFINLTAFLVKNIVPLLYWQKMLVLLIGCLILALGVTLTLIANVILNTGEAVVAVFAKVSGKEFGVIKVVFDVGLVSISAVLSLILFQELKGIREGTVISAMLTGIIVKFFAKKLSFIEERFLTEK